MTVITTCTVIIIWQPYAHCNSFFYYKIIWNSLPPNVVTSATSIASFKIRDNFVLNCTKLINVVVLLSFNFSNININFCISILLGT